MKKNIYWKSCNDRLMLNVSMLYGKKYKSGVDRSIFWEQVPKKIISP